MERICGKAFKHIPFVKVSDVRAFKKNVNGPACEMLSSTIDSKGTLVKIHQEEGDDVSNDGSDDAIFDEPEENDDATGLVSDLEQGAVVEEMKHIERKNIPRWSFWAASNCCRFRYHGGYRESIVHFI